MTSSATSPRPATSTAGASATAPSRASRQRRASGTGAILGVRPGRFGPWPVGYPSNPAQDPFSQSGSGKEPYSARGNDALTEFPGLREKVGTATVLEAATGGYSSIPLKKL